MRGVAALAACLLAIGCAGPSEPPGADTGAPAEPRRTLEVRVTGSDYKWLIRYPGTDGRLGTEDDAVTRRNLHLPAGADVSIELRSDDYAYSFYLPDREIMEVALPGNPWSIEIKTGDPERLRLLGSQMCGFAHPDLLGEVVVDAPQEFDAWLATLEVGS